MASAFNMTFVNILIGLCLASVVYFSATYLTMTAGEFLSYFTAMPALISKSILLSTLLWRV
jgi:subfamily B ATP-binding cassette protein MsbA